MNDLAAVGIEAKHILIFVGIIAVVLIISVAKIADVLKTNAREQTRREVSAYVAEGSIDPDQADRLLALEDSEAEKKIADAVAWGMLSSSKAESLIRTMRDRRPSNSASGADRASV
jgi:hypothetical protein